MDKRILQKFLEVGLLTVNNFIWYKRVFAR